MANKFDTLMMDMKSHIQHHLGCDEVMISAYPDKLAHRVTVCRGPFYVFVDVTQAEIAGSHQVQLIHKICDELKGKLMDAEVALQKENGMLGGALQPPPSEADDEWKSIEKTYIQMQASAAQYAAQKQAAAVDQKYEQLKKQLFEEGKTFLGGLGSSGGWYIEGGTAASPDPKSNPAPAPQVTTYKPQTLFEVYGVDDGAKG